MPNCEDRQYWEFFHNSERISVYDPEYQCYFEVDVLLLIAPEEYANSNVFKRYRNLAIQQGVFTPYPNA